MSTFLDDLIAADTSLAQGDPKTDATLRAILKRAAESGSIDTLHEAIERGQIGRDTNQAIVNAAAEIIGHDRGTKRMPTREMDKRRAFVGEWVQAVAGPKPQEGEALKTWNARVGGMLGACFSTYLHANDHVAGELLKMGAPVLDRFQQPAGQAWAPVPGLRLGIEENTESVTVLARAISARSRWVGQMVAQTPTELPTVATLRVHGQEHPVNAVGYAMAYSDMTCLRAALQNLRLHEPAVQAGLAQTLDLALNVGWLDHGPDEALHAMTALLAAGAKPSNPKAFFERAITLVDAPTLGGDLQANPVERTSRCTLASAILHSPNVQETVGALRALKGLGWDPNQPIFPSTGGLPANGPQQAYPIHLAAQRGQFDVASALAFIGANVKALDGKGGSAIDHARFGSFVRGESLNLDFARLFDGQYMPSPKDKYPDAPKPEAAQAQTPAPLARAPSPAEIDFDDVNAMASMAASEDRDRAPVAVHDAEVQTKPKTTPAVSAVPASASAAADAPAAPMSAFERLRQAQAARNAINAAVASPPAARPR